MTQKKKQSWLVLGGVCLWLYVCATDPGAGFSLVFIAGIGAVAWYFIRRAELSKSAAAPPSKEEVAKARVKAELTVIQEAEEEYQTDKAEGAIFLGAVLDEGNNETPRLLSLGPETRNRHCYAIGKTRTGKTTLIKKMILQDMERGAGVGFIDPHGDAVEELLGLIPDHRVEDLIYFDPTDPASPSFNPLRLPYAHNKLAEDILSVFRMLLGESSWGPRMEHLLRFGLLTLLADPAGSHSLRDLRTLYLDEGKRTELIKNIQNEQLLEFWDTEYPTIPQSAANPILNKLSAFLAPMSDLERVFSQVENDLDFSAVLNTGKILLVNLAKGILGDEPSRLLGGLIVSCIQQAALARASMPEDQRTPFYFYVDEFHNFTVASFETILSESAKYQLNLTLANQTLGQLSSSLERSIFGNCGTLISFQVSAEDAPKLKKEMHAQRVMVRPKESTEFYRLDEWIKAEAEYIHRSLKEPRLGLTPSEIKDLYEDPGTRLLGVISRELNLNKALAQVKAEMLQKLSVLESEYPDLTALKELYPELEFRDHSFPRDNDLINLPPHYSFIRIGSAQNVTTMRCLPPPDPDLATREQVRKHLERFVRPIEEVSPKKVTPEEPESFLE